MKLYGCFLCVFCSVGCQTVTTPPSASIVPVKPVEQHEICTCPEGTVVASPQACPTIEVAQEIERLDKVLGKTSHRGVVDVFYQAEVARIQQGLLSKLTCGERQQRDYSLSDLLSPNGDNVRLGIIYIESLYEHYDPSIEKAYTLYAPKRRQAHHRHSISRRGYRDSYPHYGSAFFYHPFDHGRIFYEGRNRR